MGGRGGWVWQPASCNEIFEFIGTVGGAGRLTRSTLAGMVVRQVPASYNQTIKVQQVWYNSRNRDVCPSSALERDK